MTDIELTEFAYTLADRYGDGDPEAASIAVDVAFALRDRYGDSASFKSLARRSVFRRIKQWRTRQRRRLEHMDEAFWAGVEARSSYDDLVRRETLGMPQQDQDIVHRILLDGETATSVVGSLSGMTDRRWERVRRLLREVVA